MANMKDCSKFNIHDEYYTPRSAWTNIRHLIPDDKVIFEACMLNSHKSQSPQYLKDTGLKVIYDTKLNILTDTPEEDYDIICTNPPYETNLKKQIFKRLVEIDKPFILIINSMNIYARYMREIFKDNFDKLQFVVPEGKIHFDKLDYETNELIHKKNTSFYCIYMCYKMDLKNEDLWLSRDGE